MKVALLSNVNMNPVNRLLRSSQDVEVYDTQGYGNELGVLLDRESSLYRFNPEMIFIVVDIMETIGHNMDFRAVKLKIDEWFHMFESSLQEEFIYYISDAYLYGTEMDIVWDKSLKINIESYWINNLKKLTGEHSNVRVLSYSRLVQQIGEERAFSLKMWYMGKIPHSVEFHKALANEVLYLSNLETRQSKKVLLLDLDNTLWRGMAGEHNNDPIILSDDGVGLAYKNFQRSLKQLKLQGVILGIVSKNNEADAMEIISNHPHMVLRENDFSVMKINWNNKNENIVQIAKELNIGLDSMVFVDDNEAEQSLVRETLPEVLVPGFPKRPEELASFIASIYHDYFERPVITEEDREKTEQYLSNAERNKFLKNSMNFEDYLKGMEMEVVRVIPKEHKERLLQLMNKTNQFNLTTMRFTEKDVLGIIDSQDKEIFLYKVSDRFGDNGVVAAAIVEYGDEAKIIEFTMSCRIMGRKIENAIIEDMENACRVHGYQEVIGVYKPTGKNKPVEALYTSLGYEKRCVQDNGAVEFCVRLDKKLTRDYYLTRNNEEK